MASRELELRSIHALDLVALRFESRTRTACGADVDGGLRVVAADGAAVTCKRCLGDELGFHHWTERLKRWICRRIGHKPIKETRGEPVTIFYVCSRCGKYARAK